MTQINTIFMEETIMRRTIYLVLTAMAVMMLLCGCGSKTETTETNQTTEVESEEVKEIESDTDDFVDDYTDTIESLYLLAAMQEKFGKDFNVYDAYEFECNGVEYIVYEDQMVSAEDIYETAYNLMQNEM